MIESKRWPTRPFGDECALRTVLSLLILLLLPGLALGESRSMRPVSDPAAALLDGAVVSPRHGLAYVMRPGGGIDALELASGKVRWHSDGAAKPIAMVQNRLVAQAENGAAKQLELVVLDARTGAARESTRVPLPAGVKASVVDVPGGSFRVRADSADSQLVVRWESSGAAAGDPARGYLPADGEGQSPSVASGEALVDFSASKARVQPLTAAASAAPERPALQELFTPAIAAAGGQQWLSADGRHVLVSERAELTEFSLNRHQWTIYERASGARLGSMPSLLTAAPFLVVGRTLYHASPPHAMQQAGRLVERPTSLRAVDLTNGAELWNAEVRDSAFRGPFPP
jgi:hypothetical protein